MFLYENFTYSPVFNYILVYNDMQTWRQWSPGTVYFWTEKTVPNVSRFMYFISHKYKPSWSFAKEKYMYKISVFKSIVGVLTPPKIFSNDFVKYITTIWRKSIDKLQSVSFFMLLTVHCITTLASCLTISEHIYNWGCVSFGLFTLKKSVLINKFNTFKLNNEYCKIQCKMGY